MLKHIEEFGKYTVISGFREAKIDDIEKFLKTIRKRKPSKVEIQFFDAKLVATWQHLYFAVLNALTAFKNKENISKNLTMEVMLYASATRQIRKATKLLGIKPATSNIAVLIIGESPEAAKTTLTNISNSLKMHPDDDVLELSKEKTESIRKIFDMSDLELETVMKKDDLKKALVDLVIERMALLATKR